MKKKRRRFSRQMHRPSVSGGRCLVYEVKVKVVHVSTEQVPLRDTRAPPLLWKQAYCCNRYIRRRLLNSRFLESRYTFVNLLIFQVQCQGRNQESTEIPFDSPSVLFIILLFAYTLFYSHSTYILLHALNSATFYIF